MKYVHVLNSFEQVRALTDPLRMRIVEAFGEAPRTTKQVAAMLGFNPTRLYHHVDTLERAGLIRLVETRKKRGTLEKYYRAIAAGFAVDRRLLETSSGSRRATDEYEALFLSAIESTLAEVRQTVAAHLIKPVAKGRNALAYRRHFKGSETQMRALMTRVRRWISATQHVKTTGGEAEYAVFIAFYPIRKETRRRGSAGREATRQSR